MTKPSTRVGGEKGGLLKVGSLVLCGINLAKGGVLRWWLEEDEEGRELEEKGCGVAAGM